MSFRRLLASNAAAAAFAFSAAQGTLAQTAAQPAVGTPPATTKQTYTEFNPYLHPGILGGMSAFYAAFCLLAWRRGMKGNLPRLFAGATLIYAMTNHQRIEEDRAALPTEVLIAVDESPSQSLGQRKQDTQTAQAALEQALKALPGINTRIVKTGGAREGMAGDGTRIFNGISDALSDIPADRRGAVFILSDGQIHDRMADHFTLGKNVPVHALISGKQNEYDRRLDLEEASPSGLVGKKQEIKFRLNDDGPMRDGNKPVRVSIHHDGKQTASQMVTPGQPAVARVDITHAGPNIVEIKTDQVDGEVTGINNRIVTSIEGIHEKLSVLILSFPNRNTRMWRELLKSDPNVDIVHFMIQRLPDQIDDTPRAELSLVPFPANDVFSDNLGKFNLIVFDNFEYHHMPSSNYLENIVGYVKNGGSLIVASGPEYAGANSIYKTPLQSILPAEPAGQAPEHEFIPRISARGQRHPVTRGLEGANSADGKSPPSWGPWYRYVDVKPSSGETVMEGPDKKSLVILSRQEKGRVAMINSDSMERWARSFDSPGPYAQLLLNTAHWAMKNPALEEESLKITYQGKDLVAEQQTMADSSTPVTIRTPSGKSIDLTLEAAEPGLWRAKIPAEETGIYSAEQAGKHPHMAFVNVGPRDAKEFSRTISTADVLQPFVTRSGGMIARMNDPAGLPVLPKLYAVKSGDKDQALSGPRGMDIRMTDASELRSIEKEQVIDNRILAGMLLLSMALAYTRQSGKSLFKNPFPHKPAGPAP